MQEAEELYKQILTRAHEREFGTCNDGNKVNPTLRFLTHFGGLSKEHKMIVSIIKKLRS